MTTLSLAIVFWYVADGPVSFSFPAQLTPWPRAPGSCVGQTGVHGASDRVSASSLNSGTSRFALPQAAENIKVHTSALPPQDMLRAEDWDLFGRGAGLSIGGAGDPAVLPARSRPDVAAMQQQMRHDGYSKLQRKEWDPNPEDGARMAALSAGIGELEASGVPEQFLLVFDEVWDVVNSVSEALGPIYGLKNIMDFFVFNVRPGRSGWNLHRDRPSGQVGLAADGTPDYTTVWIAISDASPETSCIYVLPAHADPEYRSMSGSKYDAQVVAFALQHVRALPVESGTVLAWSHRVLHWGSAAPEGAPEARRTLTFAMAAPGYEQPLLSVEPGQRPCFEARLALIAYTLICYHHSQPVPPHLQPVLVEILQRHGEHLTVAAIAQQTGEALFKNLLVFSQQGGEELSAAVESAGVKLLGRFGMQTDWWTAQFAARGYEASVLASLQS